MGPKTPPHPEINVVRPDGSIVCSRCRQWKDPQQHFKRNDRMKRGWQSWCVLCTRERNREINASLTEEEKEARRAHRRIDGAEKARRYREQKPVEARFYGIKYRHGITRERWEATFEEQGGTCANRACSNEATHIDHDHACCPRTKKNSRTCGECFRGLLCHYCNVALGLADDNPEKLQGLIDYLQRLKDLHD